MPGAPVDGDRLLHRADVALYRAKREGKGTISHADDGDDLDELDGGSA